MTDVAFIQVSERPKKGAKKVFSDIYFYETTITEKELSQEIKDLYPFYKEIRILGKLPPHIRYNKIFPDYMVGTAKED